MTGLHVEAQGASLASLPSTFCNKLVQAKKSCSRTSRRQCKNLYGDNQALLSNIVDNPHASPEQHEIKVLTNADLFDPRLRLADTQPCLERRELSKSPLSPAARLVLVVSRVMTFSAAQITFMIAYLIQLYTGEE